MNFPVVFFDGVCKLCNTMVHFIIRNDPKSYFSFASLRSDSKKFLLGNHYFQERNVDSIVLFENGKVYNKSTAVLKIMLKLRRLWPALYILIVIPKPLRDYIYDIIAVNRYKIFGREKYCIPPGKEIKDRFLEIEDI